ncbi:pseudouridine synthase [Seiridium cupressi]
MATHTAMTQGNDPDLRSSLERKLGILHFVSPKEHGWNGVLRKRFTDFQVHEIDENGEIVHLNDYFTNARDYDRAEAAKKAVVPGGHPDSISPSQTNGTGATVISPPNKAADGGAKPATVDATDKTAPQPSSDTVTGSGAEGLIGADEKAISKDEAIGSISGSDEAKLKELLGETATNELLALHKKIIADPKARPQTHGFVKFPQIADRSARTAVHSEIRRIFSSKIDTETNSDGIIQARAQPARGNSKWGTRTDNRNRVNQPGQVKIGKFLHFSLYKENKDTMEAINILAGVLGMKPNFFSTAGTKDRRAVTVQRVSIRGRDPKKVMNANAKLRGLAIGDFKFSDKDLYLGSHNGNEFTIVMKDCTFQGLESEPFERQLEIGQAALDQALSDISKHGFINYFGTQRFGTYEIGTQILGMKILQGDLKGVVQDLLSFDPNLAATDPNTLQGDNNRLTDMHRAKALAKYKDNNDPEGAVKSLPRRCNTEFAILKHLSKQPTDFHGAVLAITRNMRNMYLHAYQSLVWNFVASKRWEVFGSSVVKGDLVFAAADDTVKVEPNDQEDYDEENIHLAETSSVKEAPKPRVRALTEEDVASGRYSITDVVLSIPGTDVIYPNNEVGEYYKEFMSKEENGSLDPHNMHRSLKAFSLTGDYRKFMGTFIGTPSGVIRSYSHDNDQLVPTDLDLIKTRQTKAHTESAAHGKAASGWNSFSQKVRDDERKQANDKFAAAQRRKADSVEDETSDARVNDTWVQTSVDGSNKRVKVGTAATGIDSGVSESQQADSMDIDQPATVTHEAASSSSLLAKASKQDEVNGPTVPEVSTVVTSTTEGSYYRRFKKVLLKLYNATLGNFLRIFSTDKRSSKTSTQASQSDPNNEIRAPRASDETTDEQATQVAQTQDGSKDSISQDEPAAPEDRKNQGQQDDSSSPTGQQKMAVILKFSLGSSAYATMVLRELQG